MNEHRRTLRPAPGNAGPAVASALEPLLRQVGREDRLELARLEADFGSADACPSLARHRRAALRHDWSPHELLHVDVCRRCDRTRRNVGAAVWHPDVSTLAGSLADGLSTDDGQALQHHLEVEGCQGCLRLLGSPWLQELARRRRPGIRDTIAVACEDLPRAVGEFSTGTRPPFHMRAVASGGGLVVTLRETDQGQLVVHLEAPHTDQEGQTVRVELLSEGDPVVADVELRAVDGEPGCIGRHAFGPFVELVPRLRPAVALLAVLAEKGHS
jgi:hypothetical protein